MSKFNFLCVRVVFHGVHEQSPGWQGLKMHKIANLPFAHGYLGVRERELTQPFCLFNLLSSHDFNLVLPPASATALTCGIGGTFCGV